MNRSIIEMYPICPNRMLLQAILVMYKLFGCTYYNALCCYEQIQRSVDLLLIVAHVLYVAFADDFISSALVSLEIYIPAIVLTAFFVYLLPKIIRKIKSKNFRIGCVFACHIFLILFPLVPRILVFRVGWDFQMLIVLVIAPLLILHLVLYLNRYQFPTEIFYNEEIVVTALVMNAVFLVATIRFAYKLTSGWDLAAIIIVQGIFTPITFIANLDFLLILGEQRVFFPGSNLVSIQPIDKETGAQDKQHRSECHICTLEYSEALLPKILIECGHTVCADCAHQLSLPYDKQFVYCLYCLKITLTHGNASNLKKLVFFVGWNSQMLIFLVIAPLIILHLVLHLYRYQFLTETFNHEEIAVPVFVANFVFFVASIRFAYAVTSGWDFAAVVIIQGIFTPICSLASLDLILVISECHICGHEYSEDLLPKILNGCGHTVCTNCAHQLSISYDKKCVFCPYCRQITLTHGNPSTLKTNLEVLDLVKIIKELRKKIVRKDLANIPV
ncbi:unnamed protein product [Caenorhabditis nigoni]